ncbi:MAG: sulfotransferase [Nitrospiraceae bacterium]|nr:sulfotransferase [Nitrospiraceae bacterium]
MLMVTSGECVKVDGRPIPEYRTDSLPLGLWGFLRLAARAVFRGGGRLTLRRAVVVVFGYPLFFFSMLLHRAAFALDDLLFPAYRKVEVREPVFVVGLHRSGTTLIHRLLANDSEQFTAFCLWEVLFAPAIVERKLWMAVGAADRWLGGWAKRACLAAENRLARELHKIHHTSLFQPEEDELVLVHLFATGFMLLGFPFPDELWAHTRFDTDLPTALQDRVMAFYKACVQRHLYVHGTHKRLVSKNPQFSGKIDVLNRTFPDCKIVCNVRRPYEAVPSFLSLLSFFWGQFGNDSRGWLLRDMLLEMAHYQYRHPIECLAGWPENRHAFLRYDDLTRDPKAAVLDLYERLGIALTPAFDAYLEVETHRARAHRSRHAYSLEQYGLTEEGIREDFGDIFERFGFSTDFEGTATTAASTD